MKLYYKILALFLFVCLGGEVIAGTTRITGLRFSTLPEKTRLVFDTTGPINYTATVFPERIIVNIKQTKLGVGLNKKGLDKTPIDSIVSSRDKNDLRLILNLTRSVRLKHFVLVKPYRLVFDLYSGEKKSKASLKKAPPLSAAINIDSVEQKLIDKLHKTHKSNKSLRDIVIVIDPGHGGKDPGAIGTYKTREKDVTLAISKSLYSIINNTKGFRAVLTRKGDYFIPLRRRLSIAHSHKADMFISIHADAYRNRDAYGASVFALSQRGATSEAARWLAEKENESELGQVISNKSALLRSVLIDLAQTATISASLDIGSKIMRELGRVTSLHSKKVEQAAFVVLKSPDIPSLLVEVGFISYGKEERKLRNSKYQRKIATSLARGVKSYFLKYPPLGTYLAKR